MIFQPSGGAGSGGGLTVYNGYLSDTKRNVTFETPVKLVFVTYDNNDIPILYIILPGKEDAIYGIFEDTWPPERLDYVSLSADGKTLSSSGKNNYLYYAIG